MPWRHRGKWRYSSNILDLGTRLRWVVSFTPRPHYPRGKSLRYPLDRRLGGGGSRSGRCGLDKILPLLGNEARPCDPSLYRRSYPGSPIPFRSAFYNKLWISLQEFVFNYRFHALCSAQLHTRENHVPVSSWTESDNPDNLTIKRNKMNLVPVIRHEFKQMGFKAVPVMHSSTFRKSCSCPMP
jgi:hypothetical protein